MLEIGTKHLSQALSIDELRSHQPSSLRVYLYRVNVLIPSVQEVASKTAELIFSIHIFELLPTDETGTFLQL